MGSFTCAVAIVVVLSTGCSRFHKNDSDGPVLARLEVPTRALLVYENMVVRDPDRTGNWRFYFRDDGCMFHRRNDRLWIERQEDFGKDDPSLFWSGPFPSTSVCCLTADQLEKLKQEIARAAFDHLDSRYDSSRFAMTSSPSIERWTVVSAGRTRTVTVEQGAAPKKLAELSAAINRLVEAAPRTEVK